MLRQSVLHRLCVALLIFSGSSLSLWSHAHESGLASQEHASDCFFCDLEQQLPTFGGLANDEIALPQIVLPLTVVLPDVVYLQAAIGLSDIRGSPVR